MEKESSVKFVIFSHEGEYSELSVQGDCFFDYLEEAQDYIKERLNKKEWDNADNIIVCKVELMLKPVTRKIQWDDSGKW